MTQKIIIAGTGFAGLWAAISAARAVDLAGKTTQDVSITLVSPAPELHIRPRLYEAALEEMTPSVTHVLETIGATHVAGKVESLDIAGHKITVKGPDGQVSILDYDRFVLATGSQLFAPPIPGLAEFTHNVDQVAGGWALRQHLESLASRPETPERNTVVVAGAGFTGLETSTELPHRLREIFGQDAKLRVVLLEAAPAVGPELGAGPRPQIEEALALAGVEIITGEPLASVDANGVTTATGRRIDAATVIWTAGMRANSLTAQIPGEHDRLGRVKVDAFLHAPEAPGIFVTGDTAWAATDDVGHVASQSCQHALSLGRVAGHNAAAELVGLPLHPYSQVPYVMCLDLGAWGAVYTEGWDRQVKMVKDEAKSLKREINTVWIYPPQGDRAAMFDEAHPDKVIVA
jgi:NADH dehydrogenase